MKIFSKKFGVLALITFVILFLMNYLGNDLPDRLSRALLTAAAGVAGLALGFRFLYPKKDEDSTHQDFD